MESINKEIIQDNFKDKVLGCILGAFIGDASGASLEFDRRINSEKVEKALKMNGGGPIHIGPGQVTDDSELAMCLFHGLSDAKGVFNPDRICYYYGLWLKSPPFDIGNTTSNGLAPARKLRGNLSQNCRKAASTYNSCSNGSTMRMSPLASWLSKIEDFEEVKKAIQIDTNHTHIKKIVVDCNITLALCVREFLNGTSAEETYKKAKEYALSSKVKEWFEEMEADEMQPVNRKIGWVKIAFQRTFFYLKEGFTYTDAMKDILIQGGDTDTNAAIIGMVLGARDGYKKLPEKAVKKVLNWSILMGGHKRPDFLIPKKCFMQRFDNFFNSIPTTLEIVYGLDGCPSDDVN